MNLIYIAGIYFFLGTSNKHVPSEMVVRYRSVEPVISGEILQVQRMPAY